MQPCHVLNLRRQTTACELPACLVVQGDDWSEHVVADGKLITGQNPQSSEVSRCTMPFVAQHPYHLKRSVDTAQLLTQPAAGRGQGGAGSTEGMRLLIAAVRVSAVDI